MLEELENELQKEKNPKQSKNLQRFFKTGKGEYGEGDIFLGIKVPVLRKIAKKYIQLELKDVQILLNSKIHEKRMAALFILVDKFKGGSEAEKEKIFKLYLKNTKNINNWDLIDLTAPNIVGVYLSKNPRGPVVGLLPASARSNNSHLCAGRSPSVRATPRILLELAKSKDLWEKRISIISTFAFIKNNGFDNTLKISEILLNDDHDLIHKAVGWMLREVGNRNLKTEEKFLKKYYKKMPRTMLRYAIEKFPENIRQKYLKGCA